MNFEQTKLSYRIEKNCITRLPIDKHTLLHEEIRLERIFESTNILTKAQFDVVNERYYEVLRRNIEIHSTLKFSWNRFINYQIKNNPEHIEVKEWNYFICKNT